MFLDAAKSDSRFSVCVCDTVLLYVYHVNKVLMKKYHNMIN